MKLDAIRCIDKIGREIVLRSADVSDAAALIDYLRTTAGETPYLIREPDEITMTLEGEKEFIKAKAEAERELLLVAFIDGKHVGNCSLTDISSTRRCRHRCGVAIALRQEYCGYGIGRIMMQTVLDAAKQAGYEQAELEVVSGNERAIALYRSLGFIRYGSMPDNMKYADGTYADADWMMKKL